MARSNNLLLALWLTSFAQVGLVLAAPQENPEDPLELPPVVVAGSMEHEWQLAPQNISASLPDTVLVEPVDHAMIEATLDAYLTDSEPVTKQTEARKSRRADEEKDQDDEPIVTFGDWLGYNSVQDDTTWLFGRGDDFGMFSLQSFPTLDLSSNSALVTGVGIHFLNGPIRTDMPPRLFDLQMAYHTRSAVNDRLLLDLKAGVGVFSDFEGSAREGVRSQGHAVSYFEWHPWLVSVAGVEVLDRDDYSILPVFGVISRPTNNMIFELVFPRPKATFRTSQDHALYVSGELGGGTWAIERASGQDDVVTYRDLRVLFGSASFGKTSDTAFEFGWAFDRNLAYRSFDGNYAPDDAFLIQWRMHY